jgi:hopene-associated glycosyltransferase HpnB
MLNAIALISLLVWVYLLLFRGRFWLSAERDDSLPPPPTSWPTVAAVVPARNEAPVIAESISSLLRQDYPGLFTVVLVDDDSSDGTGTVARQAAAALGTRHALDIIRSQALPAGWTGKLWAVKQGVDAASELAQRPHYILLTDADIAHAPDTLRWLVAHSVQGNRVLTSFMAKLRCESLPERSHVPAFIFFFEMLFPFAWVNDARSQTAAAAGGCVLVRADALRAAGGIAAIRDALIDDCALAAKLKQQGPIWLGLTERARSIRPYTHWAEVSRMISRSAYAQLRYSPLLLAGTVLGMALTYVAPILLAIFARGWPQLAGILTWLLMAISFQPTLRFYRLSPLWGLALPGIALLYMAYTLQSAFDYMRGRGGAWKGRVQANVARNP